MAIFHNVMYYLSLSRYIAVKVTQKMLKGGGDVKIRGHK